MRDYGRNLTFTVRSYGDEREFKLASSALLYAREASEAGEAVILAMEDGEEIGRATLAFWSIQHTTGWWSELLADGEDI